MESQPFMVDGGGGKAWQSPYEFSYTSQPTFLYFLIPEVHLPDIHSRSYPDEEG